MLVESWHHTVTEPLPPCPNAPVPRISWKNSLPWAPIVPLLKKKRTSEKDIVKASLCVSQKRALEEALPTPTPDRAW